MGNRTVYGNAWSENGWPMVDQGSCQWVTVPGTSVSLQIQQGQPLAVLRAFAADFNAFVEPLRDADSACWTATNSVPTSNHLSGTALDLNWNSHPFRILNAGFTSAQINTIRDLLDFYEGTVFWGNDWNTPKDAMHFQVGYETYENPHTQDFINRKIRADGYSTFRRDTQPETGLTAATLADAMGETLPPSRYAELLQPVKDALTQSGCTNLNRIAMWLAQIGHESGGLRYMEEIADGSAYEGRSDLGNTVAGDGRRFKGRGPIQITGRWNYTRVSAWAFDNGYVPSATYFLDHPAELATDRYGFLGAVWYWTVARPNINTLCDRQDIDAVTVAINGGLNGIQDRRQRWQHCLAMGLTKLAIDTGSGDDMAAVPQDQWDRVYQELTKRFPSRSIYRTPGEGVVDTGFGLVSNVDAMTHQEYTERLARFGDLDAVGRIARTAAGQGAVVDAWAVEHAKAVLADIEVSSPDILKSYLKGVVA